MVPWIDDLGIAEEDSQGLRSAEWAPTDGDAVLDIVVLRLPHIANFDDFDPMARRPGVRLRYVDRAAMLGAPDLLIVPGTKMTRSDLSFLRERGLDQAVCDHAQRGGAVLGICGGYQMLGQRIEDPDGIEGPKGDAPGLGLLQVVTRYAGEKATVQVQGRVESPVGLLGQSWGQGFSAYEIHVGRTLALDSAPLRVLSMDGTWRPEGAEGFSGMVVGTYLHGLLGNPMLLEGLLGGLAARRGLTLPSPAGRYDVYNRLASVLRRHLDLDRLRSVVGPV